MPKSRIMYIEDKSTGVTGPARIGRVAFSKSGSTLRYDGEEFGRLGGDGFKANFFRCRDGAHFWISGCRKDGEDGLYGHRPTPIDEDVREEYWLAIRSLPERRNEPVS